MSSGELINTILATIVVIVGAYWIYEEKHQIN